MAKKTVRGEKTAAVSEYLDAHPGAGPKEIVAALAKQHIKITTAHVSNIKGKLNKAGNGKKAAKPAPAASPSRRRQARDQRRHDHAGAGQKGRSHGQGDGRLPAYDRGPGCHQGVRRREEVQGPGGSDDGDGTGCCRVLICDSTDLEEKSPLRSCLSGGLFLCSERNCRRPLRQTQREQRRRLVLHYSGSDLPL